MGESTCLLLFLCSIVTVQQLTHGASLYRRDTIPRGWGPGMMTPCPMMDCPFDAFEPCAENEYRAHRHKMLGGFCCPVCPVCLPVSTVWTDCATDPKTEAPETTEVPTKVPEGDTDVTTGSKLTAVAITKPSEPTKATHVDDDFETTNLISTVASKRDSLERQTMNTLKSFGQRFLALFRRKDSSQQETAIPGTTVVLPHIEFTVHKLDDVGGGGAGINTEVAQNDESEEEEGEEDSRKGTEEDVTITEKTTTTTGPDEAPEDGPPDFIVRDIVECPTPRCQEVACDLWNQQATWITIEGLLCPGCPRCI